MNKHSGRTSAPAAPQDQSPQDRQPLGVPWTLARPRLEQVLRRALYPVEVDRLRTRIREHGSIILVTATTHRGRPYAEVAFADGSFYLLSQGPTGGVIVGVPTVPPVRSRRRGVCAPPRWARPQARRRECRPAARRRASSSSRTASADPGGHPENLSQPEPGWRLRDGSHEPPDRITGSAARPACRGGRRRAWRLRGLVLRRDSTRRPVRPPRTVEALQRRGARAVA
jgi:hypothetical protein